MHQPPCFLPHLAVTHCVLFPTKCSEIILRIDVISTALLDDFQGFEADNASDIRPEATPNNQAFINTPHASQTFAYPGFTHTVDQKWTAALLKVMDNINAPDYACGLILAWTRVPALRNILFTHKEVWIVPAM